MTEWIPRRRQGLQLKYRESGERTEVKQFRDDKDGEEREEVENISFHLDIRFNLNAVVVPTP